MEFENLKLKSISCVLKHTPRVNSWPAKNRYTHILGIQLRGNMEHIFPNKKIYLTENTVFFFNQKDDFLARVKELGESYTVHFTTYEPIETDSFAVKIGNPAQIYSLLERLENLYIENKTNSNRASEQFYKLCTILCDLKNGIYRKSDNRLLGAREYIDSHFRDKECLDNAAKLINISRRRFNDLFKSAFGITPHEYVTSLKIGVAKELLRADGLSISDISSISGFSDPRYFCKAFKTEVGTTPGAFKKRKI